MRLGYKTITECRVLPPRIRIIYPEVSDPGARCVADADDLLRPKLSEDEATAAAGDIAALVLGAQATEKAASSTHLSRLIGERVTLADRDVQEIKDRLDDLKERIPVRNYCTPLDGSLSDIERQVLDLEKQKREVPAKLWKDVVELKRELLTERSEYHGASRRISFLAEGFDAAAR